MPQEGARKKRVEKERLRRGRSGSHEWQEAVTNQCFCWQGSAVNVAARRRQRVEGLRRRGRPAGGQWRNEAVFRGAQGRDRSVCQRCVKEGQERYWKSGDREKVKELHQKVQREKAKERHWNRGGREKATQRYQTHCRKRATETQKKVEFE